MKSYKNVLIVLGCSPKKDGRPSSPLIARVRKAVSLYRKNKYSKIILAGGPVKTPVPESEVMRVMMLNFVPENKMVAERKSKSTIENAVFCWEIIKDRKPKRVTIVTSRYHIPRTRYIFRKLYSHLGASLKFEPAQDTFDPVESVYYNLKEYFALLKLKIMGFR